jgi:hypothetical protein
MRRCEAANDHGVAMRKLLIAATASILLGGCACGPGGMHGHRDGPTSLDQDRHRPLVTVVGDKYVAVGPSPLFFPYGDSGLVVWNLPRDLDVSFPEDGVRFKNPPPGFDVKSITDDPLKLQGEEAALREFTDCKRVSPREFSCINRNANPGVYFYTLTVINSKKERIKLDPPIMNGGP